MKLLRFRCSISICDKGCQNALSNSSFFSSHLPPLSTFLPFFLSFSFSLSGHFSSSGLFWYGFFVRYTFTHHHHYHGTLHHNVECYPQRKTDRIILTLSPPALSSQYLSARVPNILSDSSRRTKGLLFFVFSDGRLRLYSLFFRSFHCSNFRIGWLKLALYSSQTIPETSDRCSLSS